MAEISYRISSKRSSPAQAPPGRHTFFGVLVYVGFRNIVSFPFQSVSQSVQFSCFGYSRRMVTVGLASSVLGFQWLDCTRSANMSSMSAVLPTSRTLIGNDWHYPVPYLRRIPFQSVSQSVQFSCFPISVSQSVSSVQLFWLLRLRGGW